MGHTLRILEPKLGFTLYFQAREEKSMCWKRHWVLGRVSGKFDLSVGLYTLYERNFFLDITCVRYLKGATISIKVPHAELEWKLKNQLRNEVTYVEWMIHFIKDIFFANILYLCCHNNLSSKNDLLEID